MKGARGKKSSRRIALCLTWDAARWPVAKLPAKARAFLACQASQRASLTGAALPGLFARDDVAEIRICWIPRLKGGDDVLAPPFPAPGGKRIHFKAVRQVRLGENLGVVYRRQK